MKLIVTTLMLAFAAAAQTTVTLDGTTYTLRAHPRLFLDGPSGSLTTSMSDTSSSGRAYASSPVYQTLKSRVDTWKSGSYTTFNYDYLYGGETFTYTAMAALRWLADGDATSLAAAKHQLNHVEDVIGGGMGCDFTTRYCGSDRSPDSDYTRYYLMHIAQAYSILRSQMTSGERQAFANKMLNDNDLAHNGHDTAQCTPQSTNMGTGTLTASGTTVTISGGDTTQFAVGGVLINPTGYGVIGRIASIVDSTHFTVAQSSTWSSITFRYSPPWNNNCGIIWFLKHHQYSPRLNPDSSITAHYMDDYPYLGGQLSWGTSNLTETALVGDMAIGMALADDDPRAKTLLDWAYQYWLHIVMPNALSNTTGMTHSGSLYSGWRVHKFYSLMALMFQNSVVSGPPLTGTVYVQRILPYLYHLALPDNQYGALSFQDQYGESWNSSSGTWAGSIAALLFPSSQEAKYYTYWLKNKRNYSADLDYGPYTWAYFIGLDPTQTTSDITGSPRQYLFQQTDYALCVSLGLSGCANDKAFAHAVSRSDWTTTATMALLQSSYNYYGDDHSGFGQWGAVHLYKRGLLLGGDNVYGNTFRTADMVIELGNLSPYNGFTDPLTSPRAFPEGKASFTRWAGSDPNGDAQSRYTYALMNLTGAYAPEVSATRVQRHFIHFKKDGLQDYIVWYDDVAAAAGLKRAYLHYTLNGRAPATAIAFSGGNNGGTVTNTQTNSRLLTAVIPTAGTNTALLKVDNSDGTYGGSGYTFRATICAENPAAVGSCDSSATAGEWMVVHKATTDTSGSMPTLTALAATNFRVVQIGDAAAPKVAAFAAGGTTYTSVAFTTTHAGTAQYVIAGLTAGTYNVYQNGVLIDNLTVNANDNTLYGEYVAGAFSITQGTLPTPTVTTTSLPAGVYGEVYSATLAATTTATWSVSSGDLPTGLSLDSTSGVISGTPTGTGVFSFTVAATNSSGTGTQPLSITVVPAPTGGSFKGTVVRGKINH